MTVTRSINPRRASRLLSVIFNPGLWLVLVIHAQILNFIIANIARDPGISWHLASGQWISENYKVPFFDPFLAKSRPWICDQWLSDIIFYQLYTIIGWKGISLFTIAIFSLLVFHFHFYRLRKEVQTFLPTLLAILFAFRALQVHLILRPVVFSFPLFALTLWKLRSWEKGSSLSPWLPLLFIFWSNLHPSFILGILLLVIAVISVHIIRGLSIPEILIIISSIVVTIINPNGIELHKSILELGQSSYFMNLNTEWSAPIQNSPAMTVIFYVSALGLMPCLLFKPLRARIGLFLIITTPLFLFATFSAIRFLPYYGIVGSVLIAHSLSWLIWKLRRARAIFKILIKGEAAFKVTDWIMPKCVIIILIFTSVFLIYTGHFPLSSVRTFGPPREIFPYDAVKFLKENNYRVIASTPDWGGFITWFGGGNLSPVIDDRNTLLGEEPYRSYFRALQNSTALMNWKVNESADAVLLPRNLQKVEQLRKNLAVKYEDDVAIVF